MKPLKNWDNKTWISSKKYILQFNKFLKKQIKINKKTVILDIGCGRGNIISNLESKNKFYKKPIGIDILKNNDIKKNIIFKQIDAINYLKDTKDLFDLILIKQTIHFFKKKKIKNLIEYAKKRLNKKGKILIFSLDYKKNEIPCFNLMKLNLNKSLKNDKILIKLIKKYFKKYKMKNFSFKVKVSKLNYINMIKKRYISCLLNLSQSQLKLGISQLNKKYARDLVFNDKLICLIFNK